MRLFEGFVMVEAAGIEPASENQSIQASPSAVCLSAFRPFPPHSAGKQALWFSSFWYNPTCEAAQQDRSPLIDA